MNDGIDAIYRCGVILNRNSASEVFRVFMSRAPFHHRHHSANFCNLLWSNHGLSLVYHVYDSSNLSTICGSGGCIETSRSKKHEGITFSLTRGFPPGQGKAVVSGQCGMDQTGPWHEMIKTCQSQKPPKGPR